MAAGAFQYTESRVNLADLRAYVGNLLDYDPTNSTYDEQLDNLLNDAQTRLLTDRAWMFCQRESTVTVPTDATSSFSVSNGSATVAGSGFPVSTSTVLPGSPWEGGSVTITDSNGLVGEYRVRFVSGSTQLFLDRDFQGAGGTYAVTIKQREVYLPGDTATIMMVNDMDTGLPTPQFQLSRFQRDLARLDRDLLGTPEAYIPSQGARLPAPRTARGVTVATVGAGRGVRTLNVYMVNVWGPGSYTPESYGPGVSAGLESALSAVQTITLQDDEELNLTPETVPSSTGLYRRYYFTAPALGINAPQRLRHDGSGGITANTDTVDPTGGVTLVPDTRLSVLEGQSFQASAIRYQDANGVYPSFMLYPHPSADTDVSVRRLVAPRPMREDTDIPLVPAAFAQAIAYAALEQVTLKHDNPALSAVYQRKRTTLTREMEARYLGQPPRRIQRGGADFQVYPNIYGPLTFTP